MFRFTQEPSSRNYNQCLAKITSLVQKCVSVQTLSVLWRYIVTWCACVWFTVRGGTVALYIYIYTLSVLWRYILTWSACVWFTAQRYPIDHHMIYRVSHATVPARTVNHTHAHQVTIYRHNTDNVCTDTHC